MVVVERETDFTSIAGGFGAWLSVHSYSIRHSPRMRLRLQSAMQIVAAVPCCMTESSVGRCRIAGVAARVE